MKNFDADFKAFARDAMGKVSKTLGPHHEFLIDHLQKIADGTCDRLMVQMPPGTAKSTYGSILFPAFYLALHPKRQIIATSHTASLAQYFGRHVRDVIIQNKKILEIEVAGDSKKSSQFSLKTGGEYFSAGVKGPITGRRADLILIDDPIKSWAEAESLAFRDGLYDWYRAELTARLKPGGQIVLIMARWHEDDIAGRLLAEDARWTCLKLPALAELDDPMNRPPGAPLWPQWQDEAAVQRRRTEVGERAFAAMYQQNPRPPSASIFNVSKISIIPEAPVCARIIRAWDLAATMPSAGRNPDYTVGLKLGATDIGQFVVLDVVRIQESPAVVEAKITAAAKDDGVSTVIALPQDPGQAGAAQIAMLTRELAGFQVCASPETGAKAVRAMPAATQVDGGNLLIVAAPWNDEFLAELRAFPDSEKDDQVDALSRAVNTLATTKYQPTRRMNLPVFGR